METRRTVKMQEVVTIKLEKAEDSPPNDSMNGNYVKVKEEVVKEESEPPEEQYIEITPNTSKTDQSSNLSEKSKALTKDETRKLLNLILLHPVITSRETKASNNQQKIREWNKITEQFNATCTMKPRTPKQLRLKWENLKKNARRWSAKKRLNREKADLSADYIPRDEILEKVSMLLRRRRKISAKSSEDSDSDDSDVEPLCESVALKTFTKEVPESEEVLLPLTTASETNIINNTSNDLLALRKRKMRPDEGREARNRAITEYYAAKSKLLAANLINVNLQNEKLQMEIELLKRKTNRLKP